MIALSMELQMEILNLLLLIYPDNSQYAQDLKDIQVEVTTQETPDEKQKREEAEHRVKLVLLQYGELVGHGDLMTEVNICLPLVMFSFPISQRSIPSEMSVSK